MNAGIWMGLVVAAQIIAVLIAAIFTGELK
jgi:hypothetical protein